MFKVTYSFISITLHLKQAVKGSVSLKWAYTCCHERQKDVYFKVHIWLFWKSYVICSLHSANNSMMFTMGEFRDEVTTRTEAHYTLSKNLKFASWVGWVSWVFCSFTCMHTCIHTQTPRQNHIFYTEQSHFSQCFWSSCDHRLKGRGRCSWASYLTHSWCSACLVSVTWISSGFLV